MTGDRLRGHALEAVDVDGTVIAVRTDIEGHGFRVAVPFEATQQFLIRSGFGATLPRVHVCLFASPNVLLAGWR